MDNSSAVAAYDDIDGIVRPAQNLYFMGHEEIVEFLIKMRADQHLHHALLFEGGQGTGKATLAFHWAWHLLADRPNNVMPAQFAQVNEACPHWRQIGLGAHPGLLHITRAFDAKAGKFRSTITVEEIRKINHFMHQSQAEHGWRIVIVDSADDMNRNAANALLKIIEEPPRKALFILISHYKGRLLPTIRSRCQTLHFKPLTDDILHQILRLLAASTGFGTDGQRDDRLISQAQGSVRKALIMLVYGGMEIAQALDVMLAAEKFDLPVASQLANIVSGRDAQIQFDYFIDHLLHELARIAHHHAILGDLKMAGRMASLWQNASDDIMQAQAYNLDRKHFVPVLLHRLHEELHG